MKKTISLKKQITFLVALPLLAFVIVLGYNLRSKYELYQEYLDVFEQMKVIKSISNLVNELQVERGLSASYINGNDNYNQLLKQRAMVDEKIDLYQKEVQRIKNLGNEKEFIHYDEGIQKLVIYRNWVDDKSAITTHLKNYKTLIYSLLAHYQFVGNKFKYLGFTSRIFSLRILEEGKENLGKLRANIAGILTHNKSISEEKKNAIINLYVGVISNIKSPLVSLSDKTQPIVSGLYDQKNFKTVREAYQTILQKSRVGNYGYDVDNFFSVITSAVNDLKKIVHLEIEHISKEQIGRTIAAEKKFLNIIIATSALTFIAILLICILMIRRLNLILTRLIVDLGQSYDVVSREAKELAENSVRLAELSAENSSAIQETASSVEEISSMVRNNVGEAEKSKQISDESSSISNVVSEKMTELTGSMNSIIKSNEEISGLIKIFEEIAEKTKIIDDIVFQTKILSFNASVEAERAGEHGRGFSVVASEVSNLALLSGKAATEISAIVKESTKAAEKVAKENKERVLHGDEILIEASNSISKIINRLDDLNKNADQILISSKDQAIGITQVNEAISELDLSTQQSVALADKSSFSGQELEHQAHNLGLAVEALSHLVEGWRTQQASKRSEPELAAAVSSQGSQNCATIVDFKKEIHSEKSSSDKMVSGSDIIVSNDDEWKKL